MCKKIHTISVLFFITLNYCFAQTADSLKPSGADSSKPAPAAVPPPAPAVTPGEKHSAVVMSFLKEKTEHSPDSVFFNILKITNTNAKDINGVVSVSVPSGWKLISKEQTNVSIAPGNTEYIPVRVSLARKSVGGVSYIINATLNSDRSLQADKNQTSASKACYVTIPKKSMWEVYPVQRMIYFDRFAESAPMQLMLRNRGNGYEVVKLELTIGSSLDMYGAMGRKLFTTVELKPSRDTVISFSVRHVPLQDGTFYNKDFSSMTVKVFAAVDTIVKKTSVNFKYLESVYYNILAQKISPLVIDVQLQNLLANFQPKLVAGASGNIFFKNDHTLDYQLRFTNIAFTGYAGSPEMVEEALWYRSRMHVKYDALKWHAVAGDIAIPSSFVGIGGRGLGGGYRISGNQAIRAAVATQVVNPVYSAGLEHSIDLSKLSLTSSVFGVQNNFSKINNYGLSLNAVYALKPGHRISLILAGSQTQHLYNDSTFKDPAGNPILTSDPGETFLGMGARAQYHMNINKARAVINGTYTSKHFSERQNGRVYVHGNGQYFLTNKLTILGGGHFFIHDPVFYNMGVRNLPNKFIVGRYYAEASRKMNSRIALNAGPVFEHLYHNSIKEDYTGDSVKTYFSSYSPKLSARLHYKRGPSSMITPHLLAGYTHIVQAKDSTIGPPDPLSKNNFFNATAGVNIVQNNWGLNVFYYFGPNDYLSQSDYYYYHSYKKSIRFMPYFQKYCFNKTVLFVSRNSYFYDAASNYERVVLNGSLTFFLGHDWQLRVDNNLYMFSRVTGEGNKSYSRSYYLGLGVHKAFDIPQPGVKYFDLKIACYKDMNGNQVMDNNEQGISDIVLSIDRVAVKDSTGKAVKQKGLFTPVEMVTDNFGLVMYYRIPAGDYNVSVMPLRNLSDLYNVNGQKQTFTITRDTTYYIPFVQSFRVAGKVILVRDEYTSRGAISPAGVRITATDSSGNSYSVLTSADGSYTLYAPKAGEYKVSVNNVFGEQFSLQESEYVVSFDGAKDFHVDFIFNEKKRKMNINGSSSGGTGSVSPGSSTAPPAPGTSSVTPQPAGGNAPKDTSSAAPSTDPGVTYRIQVGASASRIPAAQYSSRFKGADNIKEYVQNGVYKYTAGEFKTWEFDRATDYKDKLIAQGYKDAFVVFFKDGKRIK